MGTLLLVVGCVWLALAGIFVLALMRAARRSIPDPAAAPPNPSPLKRVQPTPRKSAAPETAEPCLEQRLLDV